MTDSPDISQLDPQTVQTLYDNGHIDQDTYDTYNAGMSSNYAMPSGLPNAGGSFPTASGLNSDPNSEQDLNYLPGTDLAHEATNVPSNQPILADTSTADLNPVYGVGKDIAEGINNSAQSNVSNSSTMPILPGQLLPSTYRQLIQGQMETNEGIGALPAAAENTLNTMNPALNSAKDMATEQQSINSRIQQNINNLNEYGMQNLQKLNSYYDDNNKQSQFIDPQAYVKSMTPMGKVVTALGMVVGGIGAGLTGGPNMAVQVYQQNLQNYMHSQEQQAKLHMQSLVQTEGLQLDSAQMGRLAGMSNSLSQIDAYNNTNNYLEYMKQTVTNQNALLTIGVMQADLRNKINAASVSLIHQIAGTANAQDATTLKGLGMIANEITNGKLSQTSNPNVVGRRPMSTDEQTPFEDRVQKVLNERVKSVNQTMPLSNGIPVLPNNIPPALNIPNGGK